MKLTFPMVAEGAGLGEETAAAAAAPATSGSVVRAPQTPGKRTSCTLLDTADMAAVGSSTALGKDSGDGGPQSPRSPSLISVLITSPVARRIAKRQEGLGSPDSPSIL